MALTGPGGDGLFLELDGDLVGPQTGPLVTLVQREPMLADFDVDGRTDVLVNLSDDAVLSLVLGSAAAHWIGGLSWPVAVVFGAIIVVTGPTVITPILRNLPLKKDISTVLKWEGILIDPIGALVAVLVFEFIVLSGDHGTEYTKETLIEFGKIIIIGVSIGFTSAYAFSCPIRTWAGQG